MRRLDSPAAQRLWLAARVRTVKTRARLQTGAGLEGRQTGTYST
jgi:hypothetical protein